MSCVNSSELGEVNEEMLRQARRSALHLLIELRTPRRSWHEPLDVNACGASAYILTLRLSGQIAKAGSPGNEAALVRHILTQRNGDGGFYKYPGSPSSRSVTGVATLALRACIGVFGNGDATGGAFLRNPEIDDDLARRIEIVLEEAELYMHANGERSNNAFELDHILVERLLRASVLASEPLAPMPFLEPTLTLVHPQRIFNRVFRRAWPAFSILYHVNREHGRNDRAGSRLPLKERCDCRAVRKLLEVIRRQQNENGGWIYSTPHTVLNVLAMRATGLPLEERSIQRGFEYLEKSIFPTEDGGALLSFMQSDIWDTCSAISSYLGADRRGAMDEDILPSIEFVLQAQTSDGGFAYASGSDNDPDNDTTAHALATLAASRRSAEPSLDGALEEALRRGLRFLLPKQHWTGGFAGFDRPILGPRRGSHTLIGQLFFDSSTADVTARVLRTLSLLGLGTGSAAIRRGIRYLLRAQMKDGSWWCRWWAGYLAGTGFVLDFMAQAGLQKLPVAGGDRLEREACRALRRGIDFVLRHRNSDGGWGETALADADRRRAGIGETTLLHTAHVTSALLECGYNPKEPLIQGAIGRLLQLMSAIEHWRDDQVTFTILAPVFYHRRSIFSLTLPIETISRYLRAIGAEPDSASTVGFSRLNIG
jgi:squalene cyclase